LNGVKIMRKNQFVLGLGVAFVSCISCYSRAETILYPADQFGHIDLVAKQSSAARLVLESLGANSDRFEPMSRFRVDDPMRIAGRTVGRLDVWMKDGRGNEGIANCTATLISAATIITNAHCVPGEPGSKLIKVEVRFGYLQLEDKTSQAFTVDPTPLETNRGLDYAILRVRGDPGNQFGTAIRPHRAVRENESLFVIHHPGGTPQKLTRASCYAHPTKAIEKTEIRHRCDTLPGSSGALIYAQSDGAIVGLHHSGGLMAGDQLSFNRGTEIAALDQRSPRLLASAANPMTAAAEVAVPRGVATLGLAQRQIEQRSDPLALLPPGSGKAGQDRLADGTPCPMCPQMVVVPPGSFTMGAPVTEPERERDGTRKGSESPEIAVSLPGFAVGRYAITFAEWDDCLADGGCNGHVPVDQGWGRGKQPVINVNWADVQAYVGWLSHKTGQTYRVLSETEREYVTRAGSKGPFWWATGISPENANYNGSAEPYKGGGSRGENRLRSVPVDQFKPNVWGLYNVHGNVWDWTADCWNDSHEGNPADGSARWVGDCKLRVIRGGAWNSSPGRLRAAHRSRWLATSRDPTVGFRVARSVAPRPNGIRQLFSPRPFRSQQ
jgi:formylglycine-generating enzyme required for sulfatase activity/V8-like Glu-specific endopeptidase